MDAKALEIMNERFGHDTELSLATLDGGRPAVRIVDAYYEDGCFYSITHAKSGKMQQIKHCADVAVCGEWFTGHGTGKDLGWIGEEKNQVILEKLKKAFAAWYGNGHIDESDQNTVILQIKLANGVLMSHGTRYDLDFSA